MGSVVSTGEAQGKEYGVSPGRKNHIMRSLSGSLCSERDIREGPPRAHPRALHSVQLVHRPEMET